MKYLKEKDFKQEDIDRLWGGYPGIAMTQLPKGLVSQAMVTVRIAKDPGASGSDRFAVLGLRAI